MNFVYLVEHGSYKGAEDDFTDVDKAELRGFDWAVQCVETSIDNLDCYPRETGYKRLDKVVGEIRRETVRDVLDWLRMERAELIVSIADNEACDGE